MESVLEAIEFVKTLFDWYRNDETLISTFLIACGGTVVLMEVIRVIRFRAILNGSVKRAADKVEWFALKWHPIPFVLGYLSLVNFKLNGFGDFVQTYLILFGCFWLLLLSLVIHFFLITFIGRKFDVKVLRVKKKKRTRKVTVI